MPVTPYSYASGQRIRGHYYSAQRSGELVATIGALGHLARLRWPQANVSAGALCELKRIRVGWSISGAVTAAVETAFRAIVVRSFTTDFTTAMTLTTPSRARNNMQPSMLGASGTGISTTAVMSGQTLTADAAPFAMATFVNQPSGNATVTQAVGVAGAMTTLYERTSEGQHPIVLGGDEGVVVQPVLACVATGTWAIYVEWAWAEIEAVI